MDPVTVAAMVAIFIAGFALGYALRAWISAAHRGSTPLAVPELTRSAGIQVNARVSLRQCDQPLSLIVVH
jgi:hypothetical protein